MLGVWNVFNFRIGSLVNVVYFELWIDLTVSLEVLCFWKKPVFVLLN